MTGRTLVPLLVLGFASNAPALDILDVSHSPAIFDPASGEVGEVRFQLTEPAQVTVEFIEQRGYRVRGIESEAELPRGAHTFPWDGRDDQGRPVPPEVYSYRITAAGRDGNTVLWAPEPQKTGQGVTVEDLAWNPQTQRLHYHLSAPARIRIRIGLADDGPLLRTLVDWAPRLAGAHDETWDGTDVSGQLDLSNHPALALSAVGFSLPTNALHVGPPAAQSLLMPIAPSAKRIAPTKKAVGHLMFDYARQRPEDRQDYAVDLALPSDLELTPDGVPIVRSPVPVRLDVPTANVARAINQRSETVFFVDGRFVFERETGFLPMTWRWDPSGHAPGLHHLSVNVRGYEGQFGLGTIAVWVQPPEGH